MAASSPTQFARKCQRMATTIPRAQRAANEQAARAVKPVWYAQAGLRQGSTIAGRKVSIGDTTRGTGNVVTLVRWQGPVHLVEGDTVSHVIAARRLGTRKKVRGLTNRLSVGSGLNAAFGATGANRGAFGALRSQQRNGNSKRALTIGPNLRAYAFHPGTKGRAFWRKNVASARQITTTVYKQAALPAMLREAGFR